MPTKSEAWKQANKRYRSEKTSSVQIQLTIEDKNEWSAYAEHRGMPLATLIREAIKQSMQTHGWTYPPSAEKEAE